EDATYHPLPKFPASTRDLSLVCEEELPVIEIEKVIKSSVGKILEQLELFDIFRGEQIGEGKKSVSFSLVMRSHDHTLNDEEADNAIKKVLKNLEKINVVLR
ncbi:MAG: phenylalanine--tRNA ligase subunit beta, partial [Massilioclostridium sp.]